MFRLKVVPDNTTLLLLTRDMEHVLPTMSDSSQVFQLSQSHLSDINCWKQALAAPWGSVEQCSMGTMSLIPRSKVASSGQTYANLSGLIFTLIFVFTLQNNNLAYLFTYVQKKHLRSLVVCLPLNHFTKRNINTNL